ncbi:hypothetical protein wTpre_1103 [Wolbachia endosymbiont of Trichogramma pretiosum]|nr:hypothetical protein wTpre_1103 [Wolbachia endosymbiont of Trichogramma pretiosum]
MSINIKEPGIPNTTKLTNSFARVYKFLFIIILLYRKTIYIGLFKQYFTFLKDFERPPIEFYDIIFCEIVIHVMARKAEKFVK